MSTSNTIVRSEVKYTSFSLYSDEEKKANLSVCPITSTDTFDEHGKGLPNGLYDLRMGPTEALISCPTCHTNYMNCPGHPGHIELDVPVYNPLFFSDLFRVLRSKCLYCHNLRISKQRARLFLLRLKLLEMGNVEASNNLLDLVGSSQNVLDVDQENPSIDVEAKLAEYEKMYETFARLRRNHTPDPYIKDCQREIIDLFNKACSDSKKCENCASFASTFRKDGHSKIFLKATSKRQRGMQKKKIQTALKTIDDNEEGDDNEDDDDDEEDLVDNKDDDSDEDSPEQKIAEATGDVDKYFAPLEVEAQIKLLWKQTPEILNFIWTRSLGLTYVNLTAEEGYKIFFNRVILVSPNRFRPAAKVGDVTSEHPQNVHLKKVMEANSKIRLLYHNTNESSQASTQVSKLVSTWIELQNAVNCYVDSSKDPNPLGGKVIPMGVKQILERKEGLFRRHMMGKRVNYCCRSVISPDPYLGTNEIGIPVHFAKSLDYPVAVNNWNVKYLRTLVEHGPEEYPGANFIEYPDGKTIKLGMLSKMERVGKAKLLLSTPGIRVHRHLIDGDALLVNRQPTLHKPGIMAHRARVLQHVREQTLRMNYANCNTYNADFDGDEMNCHFVQSELARAEAYNICNTDNQYIVPTSGNPLRGLIQDHVTSAVKLTCKDSFLTRAQFQQLVFIATTGLSGTEIVSPHEDIVIPPPAIIKPTPLWTGKQVISALLAHLCRPPLPPLQLDSKTRTPPTALGADHCEHEVVIRSGELLSGVLDKSAIGNASMGVVHAVYELYGAELAGRILNAFGRLFTYYLQDAGHSCGMADLVLTANADKERNALLEKLKGDASKGLDHFLDENKDQINAASHGRPFKSLDIQEKLGYFLNSDRKNAKVKLDGSMQRAVNQSASDVIKACIPNGLKSGFLQNHFSLMVMTGAKGSAVNQSQISCFLGQQALEGQRVPLMASGKSLPSFLAFDGSPRAGGFVRDRFLTGVKPQEYYFHCMAGREGLVDTAVKTSRSGYLQRCLVKHLEELKVNYDMTVRDSGNNIIQFLYGEDGLDPLCASMLGGKPNQYLFLSRNNQALAYKYSLHEEFFTQGIEMDSSQKYHRMLTKAKKMMKMGSYDKLEKGSVVMARKRTNAALPWAKGNISRDWFPAEITKLKQKEGKDYPTFDLTYFDGSVEKKVPSKLKISILTASGDKVTTQTTSVPLISFGLPDTPMSKLKLGSAVGAISEKIQDTMMEYVQKNPDHVITEQSSESSVTSDALELLLWVKYMRSLACPGEAVGCVAAQSIGEPSTQMTLNTFHLAGHGGANVTLGIPRLREIIMTASKTLKTPTMFIPMTVGRDLDVARTLSRQLSRLPLGELLDHRGGIQVGEEIFRATSISRWERRYRIRLCFQPAQNILDSFGVDFNNIVNVVKLSFIKKLDSLIKLEQRRAGENTSGKNDPLKQFRSLTSEDAELRSANRRKNNDSDDSGDERDEEVKDSEKPTKKSKQYESDEDESDNDSEVDADDEEAVQEVKKTKEVISYEDDDEEEEGVDEEKGGDDSMSEEESSSDDESSSGDEPITAILKKKPTKPTGKKASNNRVDHENVKFSEEEGWIEVNLCYPVTSRRLLMAQIAEHATAGTMIHATKNIANAYAVNENGQIGVQTEGVNFQAIWELPNDRVDHKNITSNDIWQILVNFGVEAARQSIVSEIKGVFSVYGIDVNPRHLSLIADFMTRNGTYTAMNRIGMKSCPSPFLQMSFETTCAFLTKATLEGLGDNQQSPSANIVLGSVVKVGTGCFDLMTPL